MNFGPERTRLNFPSAVYDRFSFLEDRGFRMVESLPTLVRFRKGEIEVHVFHGRSSFEIGFEVVRMGQRYSMSEVIRVLDPERAQQYRSYAADTTEEVAKGLDALVELVQLYCALAIQGDAEFFARLANQRKDWNQGYELDVLAAQLRPKAEHAFRRGNYREAAELYERIRPRLTAAEIRKLELSKQRSSG